MWFTLYSILFTIYSTSSINTNEYDLAIITYKDRTYNGICLNLIFFSFFYCLNIQRGTCNYLLKTLIYCINIFYLIGEQKLNSSLKYAIFNLETKCNGRFFFSSSTPSLQWEVTIHKQRAQSSHPLCFVIMSYVGRWQTKETMLSFLTCNIIS